MKRWSWQRGAAVLSGHLHGQSPVSRKLRLETGVGSHTVLLMQVAGATITRPGQQPDAFNVLEVTVSGVQATDYVGQDGSCIAGRRHTRRSPSRRLATGSLFPDQAAESAGSD
ncbi:MAG: hypothetical protein DYG94_07155 [Leptolyngbya sp. PLA3]|nr:MAG: hypothetical protein EDM82_06830 [Cyanobacteria bacterium CYA]MCE7968506.1 hypothetical protein [Leptolyngbya sp. PL-A3]